MTRWSKRRSNKSSRSSTSRAATSPAAATTSRQTNYLTTVNVVALKLANRANKYDAVIKRAIDYLRMLQLDEGEELSPKDSTYGGVGYGLKSRPDLSAVHFFLEALIETGVPKNDPAFKKAVIYVSRCQNFKGEHNDLPWAGKLNDGTFVYLFTEGKDDASPDAAKPGYGSMTFAGLKSLADCSVPNDDPRMKKGLEWVRKRYSVDTNPGRPAGSGQNAYYYYLDVMAKALESMKIDEIVDADGERHDWARRYCPGAPKSPA